jgi:hypothetical protein
MKLPAAWERFEMSPLDGRKSACFLLSQFPLPCISSSAKWTQIYLITYADVIKIRLLRFIQPSYNLCSAHFKISWFLVSYCFQPRFGRYSCFCYLLFIYETGSGTKSTIITATYWTIAPSVMIVEQLMQWMRGKGNRSTPGKLALVPLCPPQIPRDLTWVRKRVSANSCCHKCYVSNSVSSFITRSH